MYGSISSKTWRTYTKSGRVWRGGGDIQTPRRGESSVSRETDAPVEPELGLAWLAGWLAGGLVAGLLAGWLALPGSVAAWLARERRGEEMRGEERKGGRKRGREGEREGQRKGGRGERARPTSQLINQPTGSGNRSPARARARFPGKPKPRLSKSSVSRKT
jgi:hypothetical protein